MLRRLLVRLILPAILGSVVGFLALAFAVQDEPTLPVPVLSIFSPGLKIAEMVTPAKHESLGSTFGGFLRVAIGVAVRKDAPIPDIATPEALKRALLDARAVAYVDPTRGTSGRHFDTVVLPALGIANEVRSKAKLRPRAAQPSCCAGARPTSPSSR